MNKIKLPFLWLWNHKKLFLVLLIISGAVVVYRVQADTPPKVEKALVERGEISSVVEASGVVKAHESTSISFSSPGKIAYVGIKKGDVVRTNQLLASMDQREIEKAIKYKLLTYMKTRWDFEQGQDDKKIHGNPIYQVPNLSEAERRVLEKSQFGLDQSVLDVEIATISKEAANLIAPVGGTVVDDGNLHVGQRLSATNMDLKTIKIVDLSTLYFQANIDETDYAKMQLGQLVAIKLDSFPGQTFTGKVTYIGREGVKRTGGSIQIPVDITFDSFNADIVPELNGDVEITYQSKSDALILDKKYIHKETNSSFVNILQNNKVISKPVKIGLTGLEHDEIIEGLAEGDTVVTIVQTK